MRICIIILLALGAGCQKPATRSNEWITLFDGKSLHGWKASENPATFTVEDGMIAVHGDRAHLFYIGPVSNHNFRNFEFKASVMTTPGSNSGMYFHTRYQEEGWPSSGYEIQVNATHTDWRKTASIYAVRDVREAPHKDNEWFTQHVIVQGNNITVRVHDRIVNQYKVPEAESRLSCGTFALQGHDPESQVFYRDISVKQLPD